MRLGCDPGSPAAPAWRQRARTDGRHIAQTPGAARRTRSACRPAARARVRRSSPVRRRSVRNPGSRARARWSRAAVPAAAGGAWADCAALPVRTCRWADPALPAPLRPRPGRRPCSRRTGRAAPDSCVRSEPRTARAEGVRSRASMLRCGCRGCGWFHRAWPASAGAWRFRRSFQRPVCAARAHR